MVSPHILRIHRLLSWPLALLGLRLRIIFYILLAVKLIVCNFLSVTYLRFVESLHSFFNKEHWLEKKKEFKSSAFSLKSPWLAHFSSISAAIYLLLKIFCQDNKFLFWNFFLQFLHPACPAASLNFCYYCNAI